MIRKPLSSTGPHTLDPATRWPQRRLLPLLPAALAVVATLSSCGHQPSACQSNGDCEDDQLCVEQRCRTVCNRSSDCPAGEGCSDGVCMPQRDAGIADARVDAAADDRTGGADRALADAVTPDRWSPDSAHIDSSGRDSAPADVAPVDAAVADRTAQDSRPVDAAAADLARLDAVAADLAPADRASPDTWLPDTVEPDCGDCNTGEVCTFDGCSCPAVGAACASGDVCLPGGCCAVGCVVGEACCTEVARCCPSGHCDDDCDGDGQVASELGGTDCDDDCPTCFRSSTFSTSSPDGLDQDCDGDADDTEAIWVCAAGESLNMLVDNPSCDEACADAACEVFCQQTFGAPGSAIDFGGLGSLACWSTAYVECGGAYWCTEMCIRGTGPGNCSSQDPNMDTCLCETGDEHYF